jgi:hypothetical protein
MDSCIDEGDIMIGLSLASHFQFLVAQRAPAFFRLAGRKNDTQ